MNLKNVLKTYSLLRSLSDDESALLETLRSLSDSDREQLVESLQPEQPKKPERKQVERCTHVYESGVVCNGAARNVVHNNNAHMDYHQFTTVKPKKSAHQQSLSSAIQRVPKGKVDAADDDEDGSRCTYTMGDGEACDTTEHSPVHKPDGGYIKWHEFQPEAAKAASGD